MFGAALEKFMRYLSAKKSVDDRSLNRLVYRKLTEALAGYGQKPLKILEVGCGIGTMVARLWDWGLTPSAAYTAIDRERAFIDEARARLREFARCRSLKFSEKAGSIGLEGGGQDWLITLKASDYMAFCQDQAEISGFDLLLAHAFLDLVDLETGLPRLLSLVRPGGLYYFTLIFDGGTIFHPVAEAGFEDRVIQLYHRSMDEREGGSAGHSQAGRQVLNGLRLQTDEILAAGSSDWLVWPEAGGQYPAEEAYFLHYIVETIHQAVGSHPELGQEKFQTWLHQRHAQVEAGELIFMAHQLDMCGRR